jgi:hypothetical protein
MSMDSRHLPGTLNWLASDSESVSITRITLFVQSVTNARGLTGLTTIDLRSMEVGRAIRPMTEPEFASRTTTSLRVEGMT